MIGQRQMDLAYFNNVTLVLPSYLPPSSVTLVLPSYLPPISVCQSARRDAGSPDDGGDSPGPLFRQPCNRRLQALSHLAGTFEAETT